MLEVKTLSAWWGDSVSARSAQALFGVSLQVQPGELVVLQGLNGAGKSTLLQAIMGLCSRVEGVVSYKNIIKTSQNITNLPPHARAQMGLGYVAEDRRLFTALSVLDNLLVTARGAVRGFSRGDIQHQLAQVLDTFPALKTMLRRPASQMSGGEQQMLAIARTLMTSPQLLLLDEPCEGIAPVLVESILEALLALKQQGMPMLVAEQNHILADQADRVIQLVAGTVESVNKLD